MQRFFPACLTGIWILGVANCFGETDSACVASIEIDKPPCLQFTEYLRENGSKTVLKANYAYVGKPVTNSAGVVKVAFDAPTKVAKMLPKKPFYAPPGISMTLDSDLDGRDLKPATLQSLETMTIEEPFRVKDSAFNPSTLSIDGPLPGVVTQPIIELRGHCSTRLISGAYDVYNGSWANTNLNLITTDRYYDTRQFQFTTNYFQCYDVQLWNGTNRIVVHGFSPSGERLNAEATYVLRLDLKTNAPKMRIDWPKGDNEVSGETVTIRGSIDDISAKVWCEINESNRITTIKGIVERSGRFWLENIPFHEKTNHITIKARDVLGKISATNLNLLKSKESVSINPLPQSQLYSMQVTVTGSTTLPQQRLWVNGTEASVQSNGEWKAQGVPITKGTVAIFDVITLPAGTRNELLAVPKPVASTEINPQRSVAIKAEYQKAAIILNGEQPTFGAFKVHLTGTKGQNFILQDSTNLIDWNPILTNVNSAEVFDYYDTNMVLYGCRFFRVVPLPSAK